MTMLETMALLYGGVDRQGPGDPAFTKALLDRLPDLPVPACIADLGCGTGAGSVAVAAYYNQPVLCIDQMELFMAVLTHRAETHPSGHLLRPLRADMGALDPGEHQFDLLWSEGAAYNLTFAGAVRAWCALMTKGGIAVISEMSWFGDARPAEAAAFWGEAYPDMASEPTNCAAAEAAGFDVLFTERLPAQAWWRYFYDPVLARAAELAHGADAALAEAIEELKVESDLFRAHCDHYGYTYYALRAQS